MISTAARNLLKRISESDDEELVYSVGGGWWVDTHRTSGKVAHELIRLCLVGVAHGYSVGDSYEVWVLNEEGRAALKDSNYEPKITEHFKRMVDAQDHTQTQD